MFRSYTKDNTFFVEDQIVLFSFIDLLYNVFVDVWFNFFFILWISDDALKKCTLILFYIFTLFIFFYPESLSVLGGILNLFFLAKTYLPLSYVYEHNNLKKNSEMYKCIPYLGLHNAQFFAQILYFVGGVRIINRNNVFHSFPYRKITCPPCFFVYYCQHAKLNIS